MSISHLDLYDAGQGMAGCGPIFPEGEFEKNSLRKQVFEYVRGNGSVARSDIARALSVSAGSVTGIAAELIAAGLIHEIDDPDREITVRGRPPVALAIVPDSFHVIGIHLANERHSAILTDSIGTVLAETTHHAYAPKRPVSELIDEISLLIADLLKISDMARDQISAIGIGLAGLIDHTTGTVSWSPLLAEANIRLADTIAARTGTPVFIDNDANIVTLAELWFGGGRTKSNFAVMTVEHGVGMGLVLNNRLFRGARGMGLELGHTKVQIGGALCRCGQRGCLEAYLADYALIKEAASALDLNAAGAEKTTMERLSAASKDGDPAAQAIFENASKYLILGLANIVQLFDPGLIIVSGERMRYDTPNDLDLGAEAHKLTLNSNSNACDVVVHAWGAQVWARGASALALSAATEYFTRESRS